MNIRLMTFSDYDAVYHLWLNTPGMGLNDLDDSREGIEKYLERNPNTCFVAEIEQKLVGVILSGHDGRRGFIYHLAVNPSYRLQGIGSILVEVALQALEAEGIHKVALVVYAGNQNGNAFWEKVDFITRPDLTYRNKNIHDLRMIET
jgi:ribosomal protein S18 acetylase RimI-like enzyme